MKKPRRRCYRCGKGMDSGRFCDECDEHAFAYFLDHFKPGLPPVLVLATDRIRRGY